MYSASALSFTPCSALLPEAPKHPGLRDLYRFTAICDRSKAYTYGLALVAFTSLSSGPKLFFNSSSTRNRAFGAPVFQRTMETLGNWVA